MKFLGKKNKALEGAVVSGRRAQSWSGERITKSICAKPGEHCTASKRNMLRFVLLQEGLVNQNNVKATADQLNATIYYQSLTPFTTWKHCSKKNVQLQKRGSPQL